MYTLYDKHFQTRVCHVRHVSSLSDCQYRSLNDCLNSMCHLHTRAPKHTCIHCVARTHTHITRDLGKMEGASCLMWTLLQRFPALHCGTPTLETESRTRTLSLICTPTCSLFTCACTHVLVYTRTQTGADSQDDESSTLREVCPTKKTPGPTLDPLRDMRHQLKVGLGISQMNADSQWNPVYNAFHRIF